MVSSMDSLTESQLDIFSALRRDNPSMTTEDLLAMLEDVSEDVYNIDNEGLQYVTSE